MRKIAEFIGTEVINVNTAMPVGTVINALFDKKLTRLKYFILFDDSGYTYIKSDRILLGKDAYFVKNDSSIVDMLEGEYCEYPYLARIIDSDGVFLGYLRDIKVDDKYKVTEIKTDDLTLHSRILVGSPSLLIAEGIRRLCPRSRPLHSDIPQTDTIEATTTESEKEILSDIAVSEDSLVDNSIRQEPVIPRKLLTNFNYLLGRSVTKPIYANGSLLVAENVIVTAAIVAKAHLANKLAELASKVK